MSERSNPPLGSTPVEADQLKTSVMEGSNSFLTCTQASTLASPEVPESLMIPGSPRLSAPLSFAQQEIWLGTQCALDIPNYNEVLVLERKGPFNRKALEQSLSEITHRHATLGTTFASGDETPTQLIAEHRASELPVLDLSGLSFQEREAEVLRMATEEVRHAFDLGEDPAVRAGLLRLSPQDHVLIVTLHALVSDAWSRNVFAREIDALYSAYSGGEPFALSDLPFQYADYAYWQRSRWEGDVLEQELSYWRERLADIPPVLELPTDRPRSAVQRFRGTRLCVPFSKDLSESLYALSNQEGVPLCATLLAGFQLLLSRYTAQDDIVVGAILSGRDKLGTECLIGPFARSAIIRTDVGGDPGFRELLGRVRDTMRGACEYQTAPLEYLVKELQPERDIRKNPFFRVLFSMAPLISLREWAWHPANFEVDVSNANVDLHLQLCDTPEGIIARFRYNTDLFEAATISRLAGHFQTLLRAIVANPDEPLSRLPLLSHAERHQILVEWNDTHSDYPRSRCVHHLFEDQVGRTPDATAVVFKNQQLTYRELNSRANQLAHYLLKLGIGPDSLVGICVERSVDMVVGLLGIMKAGGAYVPLDPQYPSDRLALMLEDSGLNVLVTQGPLRLKFSEYNGQMVFVELEALCEESAENCPTGVQPENLAYVIYTSGSTGKPKGVQINHYSLVNFLVSMRSSPGLDPEDTLLAVTTISFDIAALELYLPLIVGARLVLISREIAVDGYKLQRELANTLATAMQATPATWRLLLEAGWQGANNLKILCGGEALPRELALELFKKASSLWNMYGPTETTVWSTTSRITPDDGLITIGRPIANTEVYILDNRLEPVPLGVAGELYIGGAGVARGYLHRPELTRERFIPNPFGERQSGARLYRTGDLARYRVNGMIECLGRIDSQVKVRGFRIELGEIESLLGEYAGVKQNVVVARKDASGHNQLVAYVTVDEGQSLATDTLREFLKQKLPDYMLPSGFIFLEALPLTPNGKVDRGSLPSPEHLESSHQKGYRAPTNNIESQLVEIWESVLRMRSIGVTDNFFELGGHSLLVAKLLRRIEQVFAKELSMAAIFEAPTIQQQATALHDSNSLQWRSAVVPIQPTGSRPPFFCFGFGAGPILLPLARRLGPDQPVLGVDPTLLDASQLPTACEMENIASCLAKQIREVHPEGPYYLGGFCGGGLTAYATASQLMAQGHQVALLALFEPHPAYYDYYVGHSNGFRLGWLSQRLRFHLGNLRHVLEIKEAQAYIRDHIRERMTVYARSFNRLFWETLHYLQPRMRDGRCRNVRDILDVAYHAYRPQPITAKIALFQATHREPGGDWERGYWARLADSLEIHEIPGYSNWLVRFFLEPDVEILANRLGACLPESKEARC